MRLTSLLALALLYAASAGNALQLTVTSDPPGAEVLASPLDEPVAYKKGVTPCRVTLDDARGPHMLLLTLAGHFPSYRTAVAGAVHVVLHSRDDPVSWEALRDTAGVPSPYDLLPVTWTDREAVAGIYVVHEAWAPDASGTLVNANPYAEAAVALGQARPGQERECSELWWMPWGGPPVLLWRYVTRSQYEDAPYWPDAAFSPDPRWLVHSAPVGPRERLELHCLATGRKTTIAGDPDATLCCGVFSPDGRWIACLRERIEPEARQPRRRQDDGVAQIQVMRWDGSSRRTIVQDARTSFRPTFSPDGSRLTYSDADGRLCVVEREAGSPRVVVDSRGWQMTRPPRWSPDGRRVAAAFTGEAAERGSTARRLMWAEVDRGISGRIPAVSLYDWHDGMSLDVVATGYHAEAGMGYPRVLRIDLAGKPLATLRRPRWLLSRPALAADGSRVAAVVWRWEQQPAVAVIDTETLASTLHELPAGVRAAAVGWLDAEALWVRVSGGEGRAGYRLHLASGMAAPQDELPQSAPPDALVRPAHGVAVSQALGTIAVRRGTGPLSSRDVPIPGGWAGDLAPTLAPEEAVK